MELNTCHLVILVLAIWATTHVSVLKAQYAPPSGQYTPPSAQRAPPSSQYTPPSSQRSPPSGQRAPPSGHYTPPSGQYTPPSGQHAPPSGQHAPPSGQYAPPSGQQAPPSGQYAPPSSGQQAPPSGQYAPPSVQYTPPSAQQAPLPSAQSTPPSAQYASQSSSCVNRLFPCLNYLNSTRDPPDSCCDPLKSVIKSDPQCLCKMISTQGAFQAQLLGIDVSQVEMLPGRCGQHVNPIGCVIGATTKNSAQSSAGLYSFPSLVMLALGAIVMIVIL